MSASPPINQPKPQPIVMFIIWGAFLAATGVYAFLLVTFLATPEAAERPMANLPIPGVAIVGMICAAQLAVCPFVLRTIKRQHEGEPSVARAIREANEPPDPDAPDRFLGQYQVRMIINAAFYEAIAIYGLVGYLAFGVTVPQSLAFMGLSAVLLLTMLPGMLANVEKFNAMKRGTAGPPRHFGGGA